jgi:predicted nucleic acid-binding protein
MKAGATKRLVLDASVTLAWCFPGESSAYSDAVLDLLSGGVEAVAPAIWPFDVANALLVAQRRKRIAVTQVTPLLHRISSLPISVEPIPVDRAFGPILAAARDENLTEYDAAYLELALREGLPLATLDQRLRQAARNTGVAIVKI